MADMELVRDLAEEILPNPKDRAEFNRLAGNHSGLATGAMQSLLIGFMSTTAARENAATSAEIKRLLADLPSTAESIVAAVGRAAKDVAAKEIGTDIRETTEDCKASAIEALKDVGKKSIAEIKIGSEKLSKEISRAVVVELVSKINDAIEAQRLAGEATARRETSLKVGGLVGIVFLASLFLGVVAFNVGAHVGAVEAVASVKGLTTETVETVGKVAALNPDLSSRIVEGCQKAATSKTAAGVPSSCWVELRVAASAPPSPVHFFMDNLAAWVWSIGAAQAFLLALVAGAVGGSILKKAFTSAAWVWSHSGSRRD